MLNHKHNPMAKQKEYRVGVSYEATGTMFVTAGSIEEAEQIALDKLNEEGEEVIDIFTGRDYQTIGTSER